MMSSCQPRAPVSVATSGRPSPASQSLVKLRRSSHRHGVGAALFRAPPTASGCRESAPLDGTSPRDPVPHLLVQLRASILCITESRPYSPLNASIEQQLLACIESPARRSPPPSHGVARATASLPFPDLLPCPRVRRRSTARPRPCSSDALIPPATSPTGTRRQVAPHQQPASPTMETELFCFIFQFRQIRAMSSESISKCEDSFDYARLSSSRIRSSSKRDFR